jgi:hypothetical protein
MHRCPLNVKTKEQNDVIAPSIPVSSILVSSFALLSSHQVRADVWLQPLRRFTFYLDDEPVLLNFNQQCPTYENTD